MSDLTPKAVFAMLQQDSKQGPLAKTLLAARVIAITAAVGGAVPTATNLYHSWANGIPYGEVAHRLDQAAVWERNFECKIEYRALTTAQGTRVDAGACGKTGDVSIKVTTPTGKAAYEWIAFDKLQKASKVALLGALIAPAEAGERPMQLAQAAPGAPAAPSASIMKVMCEAMPAKGTVVRVVQEGPKCFRERVSIYRGALEKRDEVACTTPCK